MNLIKFVLLGIVAFTIASCQSENPKKTDGKPGIEFSQLDFDFGSIMQGESVAHRFVFKNTGDGDLLIKNVIAGCGCTVASYPKEPIAPGEESYIETTFNSDGYRGTTVKDVEVYTNGNPTKIKLTLSASVEVRED